MRQLTSVATCCVLLGIAGTMAQPVLNMQDLTLSTVVSSLTHAGDLAVDGQGNIWVVETQGAIGGGGGSLAKVTPGGQVTPAAVAGLSEVGDLVRGQDGNIYFWMNLSPTLNALMRLTPAGILTSLGTFSGSRASGIATDTGGNLYIGYASPGTAIWRWSPSGVLSFFATGLPGGNLHLLVDGQGRLFTAEPWQVAQVLGSSQTSPLYIPPQPLCPNCGIDIPDFDLGHYGQILVLSRFYFLGGTANTSLLSLKAYQMASTVGSLGSALTAQAPALAPGLAGDFYLLQSGTLFRMSGTPAVLTFGYPPSQVRVDVDAPAGSLLVVAVDSPGISLSLPPFGTFHTSLGTSSSFFVLADGLGLFAPANPGDLTPWSFSLAPPSPPLGVSFTLEAYVLQPSAANGVFLISNFADGWL